MQEIEHKYLVNTELWDRLDKPHPKRIVQGFIQRSEDKTVRVRIKANKAYLTIKGKTKGITREEFEYEIPVNEAETLLSDFTDKQIEKDRYEILVGKLRWEVDVFHGKLSGLILAELEVPSEDTVFDLPNWVTEDVSRDPNYYNAVLIDKI